MMYSEFWDFEEWANRANIFPVFPDWSKGCLTIVCAQYTLESGCGVYRVLKLLGILELSL